MASERGVDLVEVAPTAIPPVCRLMDYGRFKYEQTKKEREARKNQKVVELKEVRLTPRTDEHDIMAKAHRRAGGVGPTKHSPSSPGTRLRSCVKATASSTWSRASSTTPSASG